MSENFAEIIEKYRQHMSKDKSIEDIADDLYMDGLTITDSMKALRLLYGISLGDAKKIVTARPVWSLVILANEPFHEDLEQIAKSWAEKSLEDSAITNSEKKEDK